MIRDWVRVRIWDTVGVIVPVRVRGSKELRSG